MAGTSRKSANSARKPGEMTVSQAAEAENRLEELRAMRRRVAGAIDNPETAPRDLASLTRRLIELSKEIEALVEREGEASRSGAAADEPLDPASL